MLWIIDHPSDDQRAPIDFRCSIRRSLLSLFVEVVVHIKSIVAYLLQALFSSSFFPCTGILIVDKLRLVLLIWPFVDFDLRKKKSKKRIYELFHFIIPFLLY